VGAGLLARSFQRLQQVDLGFDQHNVLTAQMLILAGKYSTPEQRLQFFTSVRDRMGAVPGARTAALTTDLPLVDNYNYLSFGIFGRPVPAKGERVPDAVVTMADSAYFDALHIPVLSGRGFTGADRMGVPRVALVNDDAVRTYFGGNSPIGQRINFGDPADSSSWLTIVGVVGTTRLEGVGQDSYPQAFIPVTQSPQRAMYVVVRTAGDPAALIPALRRTVKEIDAGQPVADVATMTQRVASALAPARLNSMLVAVFSVIALALAAVGIYGVVSYTVAQRTREIGIRLALGAEGGDVLRLVLRRGMAPAVGGVVVGLAGAVYLAHLARGLLYGVGAADPVSFVGAALVLIAIAALACLVPGLRAARVAPVVALAED
jgi:putative ABC transport system permease protein